MNLTEFKEITGISSGEFCKRFNIKCYQLIRDLEKGYSILSPKSYESHPMCNTYWHMLHRCYNKNYKQYKDYGGRGIRVSGEFFYSFKAFVEYMGEKPGPEYSIDRIDNDGNYERGNLRWATKRQQMLNRRSFNKTGHKNIQCRNNRFRVWVSFNYKHYCTSTFGCIENAITSREILKYRLENDMYS